MKHTAGINKKENKKISYQKLTEIFNRNLKYINFEISLTKYIELQNKYSAEDRNHLAKILSLRNIKLFDKEEV